ncbi:alpha-beta hydrolase superfamily lysophospholipase/SAM-dependent methyltransferase [Luteimonas sp. 3794]|nr:alpha-beta hydrolase superfamily lysophospholipase/SAM-dependent methyltransferase [Luteimonas sp. 3794]
MTGKTDTMDATSAMAVDYATRREFTTSTFATFDGAALFYRHWPARGASRGAIVLLHRGHEHSGRVAHLADELDLPDFDVFAWDARGNGQSPGTRGDAPGFEALVRDLDTFVAWIGRHHDIPVEQVAVVAQSVGAVVAATWVHDYAPRLRALVLASPAFRVKLYVPFARAGLALMEKLRGNFFVNSYVKPQWLTHDAARVASYRQDPLITRPISVRVLLGLYRAAERVVADAQAIGVPTQLLVSGSDFVVHRGPQDRFFERLGSHVRERHLLPGFFHDTLGERDRAPAVAKVRSFLRARFDAAPALPSLREAHRYGATFDEAQRLAWPHPRGSLQDLRWRGVRAGLRLGGHLSDGIRLGLETGFDSGSTLDYVYEHQPRGSGPVGRFVDRNYIESIGWRGIRQRRLHLHALLREAAQRLRAAGLPVRALDIAAGHGRYVLEALAQGDVRADAIALRDYSARNVEHGRALIRAFGAEGFARFDTGDAFDRAALAALEPKPTLAIVSGLYELFPDNALLQASLAGLAEAVPPGGFLAYTGQPWHPQLEFIARALTSHRDGAAWVMRRRTQAEMDQLVADAGFRKVAQRIDAWGIFTVSLAQRVDDAAR